MLPAPKRMALSRVRRRPGGAPARRRAKFIGASEIENRGSLSDSTASQVLLVVQNYQLLCDICSYIFDSTLGLYLTCFLT